MKRILIVDDEQLVADTLGVILSRSGFEIRTAYSTGEALLCATDFLPHLLLCDISMPHRDGIELMEEMNRTLPECRVLALTGYEYNVERVIEESAAWMHPAVVLRKPCPPDDLLGRTRTMLKSDAATSEAPSFHSR